MAKKISRSYKMRQDQIDFLDKLAEKEGERVRSMFVRKWVDVGIAKEKSKDEILNYTE